MTQFDFFSITSAGGRATNMDAIRQAESLGFGCWAVADGLGGHSHSEVASKVAVDAVINGFLAGGAEVSADYIHGLVQQANRAVLDAKATRQEFRAIATTLVILLSDGHRAVWAHVGDSRLYLLRGGQVATHTRDHSLSQALGGVTGDDGAERDSDALIMALGMRQTVRPRVSDVLSLCRDDAFILCVDGFWEKVRPLEMEVDLAKARSAKEWLRFLEWRVHARQKEGSDNYTAWAVRFSDPQLPAPTPLPQIAPPGEPTPPPMTSVGTPPPDGQGIVGRDHREAVRIRRSTGAMVGIAAGILLSCLLLAGGGFLVGRYEGKPIGGKEPIAAGKPDAVTTLDQGKVSGLTPDDQCLLAWAKIENSRDLRKYNDFINGSATKRCKQVGAAQQYYAEAQAWNAFGSNNPKDLAAHILKFPDSGSFPAQRQLAQLIVDLDLSKKVDAPKEGVKAAKEKVDPPKETVTEVKPIALSCTEIATSWKKIKVPLLWDNTPSVLSILKAAKDGNCKLAFEAAQRSLASLFAVQRSSLPSDARAHLVQSPEGYRKVMDLVRKAESEESTAPETAYRTYQEARTQVNALRVAEAKAQRDREAEKAKEEEEARKAKAQRDREAEKAKEEEEARKAKAQRDKEEKAKATEDPRRAREALEGLR